MSANGSAAHAVDLTKVYGEGDAAVRGARRGLGPVPRR